jgi:hypothetical protein
LRKLDTIPREIGRMSTEQNRGRRDYPPLLLAGLVSLALLAVLPSALDLPQSNPSQTLEYAPVPPEDDNSNPPAGNFSALGLGRSSGVGTASAAGQGVPGGGSAGSGVGKNPSTKRCVGSPPRQTEDPMSPPCVAFYRGGNGGATYAGVTESEVRILFYTDSGGRFVSSKGAEPRPPGGTFVDLGAPPSGEEFTWLTMLRAYQRHFNERFQTYGRQARLVVHFGAGSPTPETRRADALEGIAKVRPFATVVAASLFANDYIDVMTRRQVVTIVGTNFVAWAPDSFYARAPGLVWSYNPSVERRAAIVTSHICSKVIPHRVSFSGDPADIGKPRVFGLYRLEEKSRPDKALYGRMIRDGILACGGKITVERVYPNQDSSASAAAGDVALMRQNGVTTVILANVNQNENVARVRAMAAAQYHPEIVLAGDNMHEGNLNGKLQDPSVWRNMRAITTFPRVDDVEAQPCYVAAMEGDPSLNRQDVRNYGCDFYIDLRQLFIGIQVAGPELRPQTMDRGFHAIPRIRSDNPSVPACFYEPGDYTCVKDSQVQWWDPAGTTSDSDSPGCMRMMEGGRRYLAGDWPPGDIEAQRDPASDPCNIQARDAA